MFTRFAVSREEVFDHLGHVRAAAGTDAPAETERDLATQSRNVIRLLTSAETGGVLSGPPLQVDIASEPGYAAVWGRDASWIEFAFQVQSPEGFWLHRLHTDYSVGSSWGMHHLDETGIILRLLACYTDQADDLAFAASHLADIVAADIVAAANFLADSIDIDGLPLPGVDLWEERESHSAYTTVSFIGGPRAAAHIVDRLGEHAEPRERWTRAADLLTERTLETFWSDAEGRFRKAVHSRNAPQLDDATRDDVMLSAGAKAGTTPLPRYPELGRRANPTRRPHRRHLRVRPSSGCANICGSRRSAAGAATKATPTAAATRGSSPRSGSRHGKPPKENPRPRPN